MSDIQTIILHPASLTHEEQFVLAALTEDHQTARDITKKMYPAAATEEGFAASPHVVAKLVKLRAYNLVWYRISPRPNAWSLSKDGVEIQKQLCQNQNL